MFRQITKKYFATHHFCQHHHHGNEGFFTQFEDDVEEKDGKNYMPPPLNAKQSPERNK